MFKIPESVQNKYEFVTLAAQRAEQLQCGAPARVKVDTNKVTVVAQAEVAGGLIEIYDPAAEMVDGAGLEEEE